MSEKEKTDNIQEEIVEEKIEETTDKSKETESKSPVEIWDEADLVSICGQCGEITKVATYVGGVQWIVVTRSDSVFSIKCPKCKSEMSLTFQNGKKFTEEEKEQKRQEQQKLADEAKEKFESSKSALKDVTPIEEDKAKEDESQKESIK